MPGEDTLQDVNHSSPDPAAAGGHEAPSDFSSSLDHGGAASSQDTNTPPAKTEANPSAATDAAEGAAKVTPKQSRLDSVMQALGIKGKKDGEDGKPAGRQPADPNAAPGEKPGDKPPIPGAQPGETKDQTPIPKEVAEHPAFKKMQTDLAVSRDMADKHNQLINWMQTEQVTPENMQRAAALTALSVKDPEAFYNRICEIQQDFAIALGKSLPADLQKDVDEGAITEERARELSKARFTQRSLEQRQQTTEQRDQERAHQDLRAANQSLVNRWFDDVGKRDPSLGLKIEAITGEFLRLKQLKGDPSTPAAALAMLDEAHKAVTTRMTPPRSNKPYTPSPVSASGVQPASSEKKTMLSTVEDILNKRAV